MGMPMDWIIPEDEGEAASILGESFPPLHAFEALLLALTMHPDRQLSQQQTDAYFRDGLKHENAAVRMGSL